MSSTAVPAFSSSASPSNTCCGGKCLTKNTSSVLTWSNPQKSGIIFGSIISGLLLVKYVNLVSVLFYVSSIVLLAGSIVEFLSKSILGKGLVTQYKPITKNYVGNCVEYYAPHFVKIFKKVELKVQNLLTCVDVKESIEAGFAAAFLYKLTSIFSLWTIAFYSTIVAFAAPKIYLSNKTVIDANVEKGVAVASAKAKEYTLLANEKLGPHIEKAKSVLEPVIKMIESKIPVRTAGTTVKQSASTPSTAKESIPVATTTGTSIPATFDSTTGTSIPATFKSTTTEVESEIDFNKLGEDLKKEAVQATEHVPVYTREKIDAPPSI